MRTQDDPSLRVWANTASKFLMLGCGVLLVWYLTRRLGVISYGEYSSMVALAIWCRFPVDVLLQSSVIPLVASSKDPDRVAATYMRSILLFASISSCLALAIGSILFRWANLVTPSIWFPLCVDVFAQSAANGYIAVLAGKGRFFASSLIFSLYWLVRTSLSILLVESGFGAMGVAIALPIASTTQFLLCAVEDRFHSLYSKGDAWAAIRSETAGYGVNVGLERFLSTMDLVLMKFFGADARAIGYYAAATNLSNVLLAISGASNAIYLQSLTQAHNKQQPQRFARLCKSLLQGRLLLMGLSILAIPFLPIGVRLVFGKEFESIHWVAVMVLVASSLRMLLAAGRILNRACSEPPQIRGALICLILLSAAGLAFAIFRSHRGSELSQADALWQATCCALVPIIGMVPMTVYSLRLGLTRSKQVFPWASATRILSLGSLLAILAWLFPIRDSWEIGVACILGVVYLGLLNLLGDLNVPWSKKRS